MEDWFMQMEIALKAFGLKIRLMVMELSQIWRDISIGEPGKMTVKRASDKKPGSRISQNMWEILDWAKRVVMGGTNGLMDPIMREILKRESLMGTVFTTLLIWTKFTQVGSKMLICTVLGGKNGPMAKNLKAILEGVESKETEQWHIRIVNSTKARGFRIWNTAWALKSTWNRIRSELVNGAKVNGSGGSLQHREYQIKIPPLLLGLWSSNLTSKIKMKAKLAQFSFQIKR